VRNTGIEPITTHTPVQSYTNLFTFIMLTVKCDDHKDDDNDDVMMMMTVMVVMMIFFWHRDGDGISFHALIICELSHPWK